MISTSSHNDWQSDKYRTFSISGNRGKDANYEGNCYPALAPKLEFWKEWHDNIGKIPDEENNRYYIQEYWNQVLSKLDPEKVFRDLDDSVLLCYEPNTEFCHRHIVAAWFELLLGVKVPEMKANGYQTTEVERPEYIKQYLDEIIRINKNMRGFTSLRKNSAKEEFQSNQAVTSTDRAFEGMLREDRQAPKNWFSILINTYYFLSEPTG